MTLQAVLAVLAAGALTVGTPAAVVQKSEEAVASIDVSGYYFGVLDLSYADFYYGEINHIQPDGEIAGQYDVEDVVSAAGLREEGMYDAVTSATNAKSTRFEQTYYEEEDDTVYILGASNVNVAISKELYDDVQNAIEQGTECSNPLVDLVSALGEVSEEVPAEYKVINSDGTLSETIGTTVDMTEETEVSFSTYSTWGHYQIDFEGLEIESADLQGGLIETSDGMVYGLEHLDNLWLRTGEIAFAVEEMTEPHGNTPSYQRFADLQGKTITKVTYMIANQDDISIETELYVKELLPDDYSVSAEESVTYSAEGTQIAVEQNVPEGSEYTLTAVLAGRSTVEDDSLYSMEDGVVTLSAELKPGSYSLNLSDEVYADLRLTVMVESGLAEDAVKVEDNTLVVAENESGLTAADYIAAISSVTLNGEPVRGRGLGSLLFNEDGSINFDAELDNDGEMVKIFDENETYEIEIEATAYPSVSGSISAN